MYLLTETKFVSAISDINVSFLLLERYSFNRRIKKKWKKLTFDYRCCKRTWNASQYSKKLFNLSSKSCA